MSDTIEWLEHIGKNAGLRYAPADELAHTLEQSDASAALKASVMRGDSSLLSDELGHKPVHTPQFSQAPGHEDDEPDHDDDDKPHPPAAPEEGKRSSQR